MKNVLLLFITFFLFYSNSDSQTYGWVDISGNIPLNPDSILFTDIHAIGNKVWISSESLYTSQCIFYSSNGGETFIMQSISRANTCIDMRSETEGYVGDVDGRVHRTIDGGNNWYLLNGTLLNVIRDISFPSSGTDGYVCGNNGWVGTVDSTGITSTQLVVSGGTTLYSISFPTTSSEGWVCGAFAVFLHYTGISWEFVIIGGGGRSSVYVVPNTTEGWIVGDGGLIDHTSDGITWSPQANPDTMGYTLMDVFSLDGQHAWAVGPGSRILHTTNGGTNWILKDEGLTTENMTAVFFTTPTNGYAVGLRVVLKYTEIIGISPIQGILPDDYALLQNYPNPFNPKTTIEFDIPKAEFINLTIYDALGREVATLVNEELKAGRYKIDWLVPTGNATDYSSGIYYYQLKAGDCIETRKMVLIK